MASFTVSNWKYRLAIVFGAAARTVRIDSLYDSRIYFDTFYRVEQPYADLKRKNIESKRAILCFSINYMNDLPILVTYKAIRNKHWKIAFLSFFSFCSSFIPALAANMFYPDFDGVRIIVDNIYFPIVIAYMSALIAVLMIVIPGDTRHLPHEIETISDHIGFLSQSSLLNNDEFVVKYPLAPPGHESQSARPRAGGRWRAIRSSVGMRVSEWIKTMIRAVKQASPFYELQPAKQVKRVLMELEAREPGSMPRFGIWKKRGSRGKGRRVIVCGRH
jgi:hypothetical protein